MAKTAAYNSAYHDHAAANVEEWRPPNVQFIAITVPYESLIKFNDIDTAGCTDDDLKRGKMPWVKHGSILCKR